MPCYASRCCGGLPERRGTGRATHRLQSLQARLEIESDTADGLQRLYDLRFPRSLAVHRGKGKGLERNAGSLQRNHNERLHPAGTHDFFQSSSILRQVFK